MSQDTETDKCVKEFKKLYRIHGIQVLATKWMKQNSKHLHYRIGQLVKNPLTFVAEKLGILKEYEEHRVKSYCLNSGRTRWTDDKIDETIKEIIKRYDCFPSIAKLEQDGNKGFVSAIFRRGMTIEGISEKYNLSERSKRTSRNGSLWDSFAETCAANFLWGRGIDIERGGSYDSKYKEINGKDGRYDIEFIGSVGDYEGKRIYVEIWGDLRSEKYAIRRKMKEDFHKDNPYFLGMQYRDCYNEKKLVTIFEKYIGILEPSRFVNQHDKLVNTSQWSLIDSVIAKCKIICENIDDGILPPLGWFTKSKTYSGRQNYEFEKGLGNMGNLAHDIAEVGGVRLVRTLLGQSQYNRVTKKSN